VAASAILIDDEGKISIWWPLGALKFQKDEKTHLV
jgi:hypothetical protein